MPVHQTWQNNWSCKLWIKYETLFFMDSIFQRALQTEQSILALFRRFQLEVLRKSNLRFKNHDCHLLFTNTIEWVKFTWQNLSVMFKIVTDRSIFTVWVISILLFTSLKINLHYRVYCSEICMWLEFTQNISHMIRKQIFQCIYYESLFWAIHQIL